MNTRGNGTGNGIETLLKAAESLGDHYVEENHQPHPDRNNFHGYARSPPERAYIQKDRIRDKKSDDRIRFEPKERQRPGGRIEHNRLEKDRRAQLKQNFNRLKEEVPTLKDKKTSNQAILRGSQKYIQTLTLQNRKQEREIQDLANTKSRLLDELKKCKEVFEQTHIISADEYLESLRANDTDDQASDTTLSATEDTDNYNDFLDQDEVDVQQGADSTGPQGQMPPPPAPLSSLRCIPHPVIREVPPVNQRHSVEILPAPVVQEETTPSAIPRATAKKLQAKLTSTRQPPPPQDTQAAGNTPLTTAPRPVTVTQSMASSFIRPRIITSPPALPTAPGGVSRVPLSQGRMVGQSLLTPSGALLPTTLVPTFFQPTTASTTTAVAAAAAAAGVVVPATVEASAGLLSAGMQQRFSRMGPVLPSLTPLKDCHVFPRVIVATGDNRGPWIMNPPNVIVMSNTLPAPSTNPAVSTHVAL